MDNQLDLIEANLEVLLTLETERRANASKIRWIRVKASSRSTSERDTGCCAFSAASHSACNARIVSILSSVTSINSSWVAGVYCAGAPCDPPPPKEKFCVKAFAKMLDISK